LPDKGYDNRLALLNFFKSPRVEIRRDEAQKSAALLKAKAAKAKARWSSSDSRWFMKIRRSKRWKHPLEQMLPPLVGAVRLELVAE